MRRSNSPIQTIRRGSVPDVLDTIRAHEAQTPRHLRAFLERCNLEIVSGEPKQTTLLCLEGPDYVVRSHAPEERKSDFLAWAYAILGTCFSSRSLAIQATNHFGLALSLENVSNMERAGVLIRQALHVAYSDWTEGHQLANHAVELASTSDDADRRDDRSLQRNLSIRGAIRAFGADIGEPVTHHAAAEDFRNALVGTNPKTDFYTRQNATLGLATLATRSYLAGHRLEPPTTTLKIVRAIQAESRRRRIPKRSLLDCYCRWTEGLALFVLAAFTLTRHAHRTLLTARRDFVTIGKIIQAVELTMDIQWCLIHSEKIADAAEEQAFIDKHSSSLPEAWIYALDQWKRSLTRQRIQPQSARLAFKQVRGISNVVLPSLQTDPIALAQPIGW